MTKRLLSCDWGTSRFRLRLVETDTGIVRRQLESSDGIDRVANEGEGEDRFRRHLDARVTDLLSDEPVDPSGLPLWVSGMASSSIGWRELPYATVPFALDGSDAYVEDLGPLSDSNPCAVRLVSGLRTDSDVLRGEETEALGILAATRDDIPRDGASLDDCTLVLPGTHSKHLFIEDDRIVGFDTFMTGEIYEILRQYSILRHSVEDVVELDGPRQTAFREGVSWSRDRPLLAALFAVRTRQLLTGKTREENGAFLSGLLVGSELATSSRRSSAPVLIGVCGLMATLYAEAAKELGMAGRIRCVADDILADAVPRGHALLDS